MMSVSAQCSVFGYVEVFNQFIVQGWAIEEGGQHPYLYLSIDGEKYSLDVLWMERNDVAENYGSQFKESGFSHQLSGEIFEKLLLAHQSKHVVELIANDFVLPGPNFSLVKEQENIDLVSDLSIHSGITIQPQALVGKKNSLEPPANKPQKISGPINKKIRQAPIELPTKGSSLITTVSLSDLSSAKIVAIPEKKWVCHIEEVLDFHIRGWGFSKDNSPLSKYSCTLVCNGHIIDAPVIFLPRHDVCEAYEIEDINTGFEIIIPSDIWQYSGVDSVCTLAIWVEGQSISSQPINVSREHVIQWLTNISLADGKQKAKKALDILALEHIHIGNFQQNLTSESLLYYEDVIKYEKLENLIDIKVKDKNGDKISTLRTEKDLVATESSSTLFLWEAMYDLNSRLVKLPAASNVYPTIIDCLRYHHLIGESRDWYLFLATQLTCENGEFPYLVGELDASKYKQFADLSSHSTVTQMSLALPILSMENKVDWVARLLYRIGKNLNNDWFHSSCIKFTTEVIQSQFILGHSNVNELENFHHAIFDLLASFKGEWFSRLYDYDLVKTVAKIIENINLYQDQHRHYVVSKAISFYGLNPYFWRILVDNNLTQLDEELLYAECYFSKIYNFLVEDSSKSDEEFTDLETAIEFFQYRKNADAIVFLRELCMNRIKEFNETLSSSAQKILYKLLELDNSNSVRIISYPLDGENRLQPLFLQTQPEYVHELLHDISESSSSKSKKLCYQASRLLWQLKNSVVNQRNPIGTIENKNASDIYTQLSGIANALSHWHDEFISFDILIDAFILSSLMNDENPSLLMRAKNIFEKVIKDIDNTWYLPASVEAGLSQLKSFYDYKPSILLTSILAEFNRHLTEKFSPKRRELYPVLSPDGHSKKEDKQLLEYESKFKGWPFDTLVAIFVDDVENGSNGSKDKAYQYWLPDLEARQIPYVFVVSNDNNFKERNVVSLKVKAKGRNHPKKTLSFLEWVYQNTDFQYILKIDDNCYLDVDKYFDSRSYRKYFYYGSIISTKTNGFERVVNSEQKLLDLSTATDFDLSSIDSIYVDGRFGYSLSRLAIKKILDNVQTFEGKILLRVSAFEDKLIGDLLSQSSIDASNQDFECFDSVLLGDDSVPISTQKSTFFPSTASITKTARVDISTIQSFTLNNRRNELWPKKIWPTCWWTNLKPDSNQLELLTDIDKFSFLISSDLVVIAVARNEMVMLPHFLQHYRDLGVKTFILVDNCSDDGSRAFLFEQPDVILFSTETEYKKSHYGVAWQQAILGNFCLGKWVIVADLDEFIVYENCETKPLASLVEDLENEKANGALVYMVDMYPYGDLDDACFITEKPFIAAPYFDRQALIELRFGGGMYSNSRNFVNGFRHRIAPSRINAYVSQKYALFKYYPWLRLSEGIHYAANIDLTIQPIFFAHFKYHSGFKQKVITEVKRKQHFNGAEEYKRYMNIIKESEGGFGSKELSEHYEGSHSFIHMLENLTP